MEGIIGNSIFYRRWCFSPMAINDDSDVKATQCTKMRGEQIDIKNFKGGYVIAVKTKKGTSLSGNNPVTDEVAPVTQ